MKRVIVIGDLHCGHATGLTTTDWMHKIQSRSDKSAIKRRNRFTELQLQMWRWYTSEIKKLGRIDICMCMGDLIDGAGERSGGTELIVVDKQEQAQIAIECISEIKAKKHVMVYGTPYHTGRASDRENLIAEAFDAKIGSHEWPSVNGVVFDLKHKVGSSTVPHGRGTPIMKEKLWSQLWEQNGEQPKSDIILRGHVHYHTFTGGPDWLAMTCPALQGMGTKYGGRQCSGIVHFGFLVFEVSEKGEYTWQAKIAKLEGQKARILKL